MPGRLRTKSRGHGPQFHRLIHVEIYVVATLIAVAPIGLVVAAIYFGSDLLFALGGDPGETERVGLAAFRDASLPALYAILALALAGALVFARRIATPLAKMLNVTGELTSRDVWGRADLRRQSKYKNLSNHLQYMADDLAQQFNARKTLSSIDQVILSGADISLIVEIVLRHLVESVHCRRAMVTILGDAPRGDGLTAEMARGHPVTHRNEVKIGEESRDWLAALSGGTHVLASAAPEPSQPFVARDARATFVLPIQADDRTAAAVSIVTMDETELDEPQLDHVRDLAGRLAVALEAVSRSERLRRKAYFDDLTGLPNRDFCFARLDRAIRQAKHLDTAVALMFIDLDGFKAVNDSLGHIAGDELLRQASYRLSSCVGESGALVRHGGDDFA